MTNTQSKYQDANAQGILNNALLKIDDFCEKNTQFSIISALKNQTKEDNIVLLDNNSYYLLHIWGIQRHSVRGSDGTYRTYIYDDNDGIYKTKNNLHILAPHIFMIYELRKKFGITVDMEKYWDTYSEGDRFNKECVSVRNSLHTGNHHRNKWNRVPQSVYGMR